MPSFDEWFKRATGNKPYPFQVSFACEPGLLSNPSPSGLIFTHNPPGWEMGALTRRIVVYEAA